MKNAANNGSDKIKRTGCSCGGEELALVVIEFSVWRRRPGRVAAVTRLIVSMLNMASSGGNPCICFLSTAELSQDLKGQKIEDIFFFLPLGAPFCIS